MINAGDKLCPHSKAHVLAVDLPNLLGDDRPAFSQRWNIHQQLFDAYLGSGVSNIVEGAGRPARNRAASTKNHQFLKLHIALLHFI